MRGTPGRKVAKCLAGYGRPRGVPRGRPPRVPACMNGSTRSPLSQPGARRTHLQVQSPGTPDGARRPCGPLLQPAVGVGEGVHSVGGSDEPRSLGRGDASMKHHPFPPLPLTLGSPLGDSGGLAVWLGRHTPEKISGVPKAPLRSVRNRPWRVRPNAGLTAPLNARGAGGKPGPSERSCPHWRGPGMSEKVPQE